jgi:hypothetical protein
VRYGGTKYRLYTRNLDFKIGRSCPLLADSGHRLLRCTCLLLTQSGLELFSLLVSIERDFPLVQSTRGRWCITIGTVNCGAVPIPF